MRASAGSGLCRGLAFVAVLAISSIPATPARAAGAMSLTIVANPVKYTGAGVTVTYKYTVTKVVTGEDTTLNGVSVTDTRLGVIPCSDSIIPGPGTGTVTCTKTYVTTAADVANGSITNNATATALLSSDMIPVSASGSVTITFAARPSWTLTKTASPTTYARAGETITYTYGLANTGNVAISTIALTDNKIGAVSCPSAALAIGGAMTCTATYATTDADVNREKVTNVATATGTAALGTLPTRKASATVTLAARPSWTLSKTASPTTYDRAGQTITYSYALANTGNTRISGIVLVDNKIGTVACPSSVLAIGASMTCRATYVTTTVDVSRKKVVNHATATGTPASGTLAPRSATATITFSGVTGAGITIVVRSIGGDATFAMTSNVVASGGFSLTTSGGAAQRRFPSKAPGTYLFTETLPSGWHLSNLTCVGDAGGRPTTVDIGAARASVGLDAGEAITCTFVNSRREIKKTGHKIARYLENRLQMLLDGPDRARLIRRTPGLLWQSGPVQPFSLTGATTETATNIEFSTSLLRIASAQAAAARAQAGNSAASKPRFFEDPGFDVWVEGHYNSFRSTYGNADGTGPFGIVYLGADYLLNPNVLVGALVQFDWMKMTETGAGVGDTMSGHGVMAGPYASVRLAPQIFLDGRFAWGVSDNKISPTNTYTDSYSTDRWLGHVQLTGNWHVDAYRVTPSVALDYGQEHQHAYTDSTGALVPSQTVSLGRVSFGPEIARRFATDSGMVYEPMVALTGQWNFKQTQLFDLSGLPVNPERWSLRGQVGIMANAPNGAFVRAAFTYDGIGSSAFRAIGGEVWLNIPLQ